MMKMLSNNQIKTYLEWSKSKNKRKRNKAKSRLGKDFKHFAMKRFRMIESMYKELKE